MKKAIFTLSAVQDYGGQVRITVLDDGELVIACLDSSGEYRFGADISEKLCQALIHGLKTKKKENK